jgi:DNA modification methylase
MIADQQTHCATSALTLTQRDPRELKPDPGNARTHSRQQIEQIAASITAFGFSNPILVDVNDVVIAGHGRLRAAAMLGLATVPVIALPALSPAQVRALRLADNKIALNAGWDLELLKVEFETLGEVSFDLTVTGFSSGEIDVVLQGSTDPDDEVVPACLAAPVTQPGDVWILGEHRLICGDCRDEAALDRLMAGRQADAAFLDPPYNVQIDGNAVAKGRHANFAMACGEMSPGEFTSFLEKSLGACARVSRDGAVHFVCMDHRHIAELSEAGDQVYGARLNICVWNKSSAGMGSLYRSKHELVFVYRVGERPHFNAVELGRHGRNRTNVWDYASVNSLGGSRREDLALHPTVKPVGLVADAIKDVTRKGDLVLDAFLGSGTSLIAAERSGRRCFGVELEPRYVDVAIERWTAMTGRSAVLEASGASFERLRQAAEALEVGHGQ